MDKEIKVLGMGGFLMTIYGPGVRSAAADMFERGFGRDAVACALGIPSRAVRQWHETFRAVGREVLLDMGKARSYDWGTKVAAASAVVDSGRAKPEVMREFGIASKSPLDSWCRKYREGGAEALRPKPKGRPKGAEVAPATREQQLEREVRRLEAQVAYLKKSIALKAELGLLPGRGPRP